MTELFISYARKDNAFIDRLRSDLQQRGINFWLDRDGLSPGTPSWESAIRAAIKGCSAVIWVVSPASFDSPYVRDEIAIAQMQKRTIYPLWADGDNWLDCVPLGTGQIQYADARREKYESGLHDLLKALSERTSALAAPPPVTPSLAPGKTPRNPYKGLAAFTEADAGDFFGREGLTGQLVEALAERLHNGRDRFMAVMGPSGAGKSSVVMAGMIPALKAGGIPGSNGWTYLPRMVPGAHPLEALADALYSAMPEKSLGAIETDLKTPGGRMLHRLARQLPGERVWLYIDQFEELFTLTADPAERQQFIDLIAQAATEPNGKLMVALTMRADFYGHPMHYPQLGVLVTGNNLAVLPMSISELWEAIEKPARLPDVGLTFEDGLAAEIIFSLRERDQAMAGALPLLEFTLTRLFAERAGARLTLAAYQAMGGVAGAIGAHCEAVFNALPDTVQERLGAVFLPLVAIDEEKNEATRRRALLDQLRADPQDRLLTDALVENRLLQTGLEGEATYVEIAHEALFRSWGRLVEWVASTRQDVRLLRQAEREARDWDRSYLPSGERLLIIQAAVERLGLVGHLEAAVEEFLYPQAMLLRELENPQTTEQRRLQIGDYLALLGDPRDGVGVSDGLPDLRWLPMEGSPNPVTIKDFYDVEIGSFAITPFYISQYAVTYAQYQIFERADDGYSDPLWWKDFPPEYRLQELAEQRTQSPNNARDSLNWYQSVAFAHWLTHRYQGLRLPHPAVGTPFLASAAITSSNPAVGTPNGVSATSAPVSTDWIIGENAEIRLPTEWEWQWAAQGGSEARAYPWGYEARGKANTSESGLGRAMAVGLYPLGAAHCGALDMAGNVWEWCLNDYANPATINGLHNGENKALRGGAFDARLNYAAAAYRVFNQPFYWTYAFGLRLVVGSPMVSLRSGVG